MKAITRPAVVTLLLLLTLAVTTTAQQKRQAPAKPQPKPAATPAPAPTFDTLVPADTYILYGEVRGVGQFIRSSSLNDLLEPVLQLSGPPKEFRTIVKWLNAHSEEMMTSRLLLATWPNDNSKSFPETIVAIEFPTAEEATKFTVTLNDFLPKILPASAPESAAENTPRGEAAEKPKPPAPNFHLKRFGTLVVITPKVWTIKQLKPAGGKLLAEDVNFRSAHNRFNSEPLFVYFDTKTIERQEEESRKRFEQQRIEAQKQAETEAESKKEEEPEPEPEPTEPEPTPEVEATPNATLGTGEVKEEATTPEPFGPALFSIFSAFDRGESKWPDGVGFALSYEGDSFDLRALLVNQAGERADAIPFLSMLISGAPVSLEAANIFPADTELMATMSLDLPQIYATLAKPRPEVITNHGRSFVGKEIEIESPFADLEKRLKISIKDDLLPLLGSEVAIRLPMNNMGALGLPTVLPSTPQVVKEEPKNQAPVVAIAIKDREAVRTLMPKLVEALGFAGAKALAQTERKEDTEIVSYANVFAYAFVGNFLVISGDAASTRYVVDSYLKHETLAADVQFRNSTRWQPKPQQGQLYISPSLMEGYKLWAQMPSTRISEQTRAFLMRASSVAQPITYSLSNEGLGPLHEVHIPKNLVLMAVAGISGESNPPQTLQNERLAIGVMYSILYAEFEYKKQKGSGSFGTLEQLIDTEMVSKETIERSGYKFELTVGGDRFEVSAVPVEYGKGGTLSLYIDNTRVLRAADHNGASATSSDPPISN
jgi:hypothetical protein